jgi:sugar phosphate isomerase/epimerase
MRLGINHHLLFPRSFESAETHIRTLPQVLAMDAFEVVDLFILDESYLDRAAGLVAQSGKQAVYNCPLMTGPGFNPHSFDEAVRQTTLSEAKLHMDRAKLLGARMAVVASGSDPGEDDRAKQSILFADYVAELCRYAGPELELIIEPFDRSIGKRLLIGSTPEAAAIVELVRKLGVGNVGLLIDMGHVPLMEETFDFAIRHSAPYIRHVHLGSCVMNNPSDPLYGDMHPPWGYPGGENDVPELVQFLCGLFEVGYLGEGKRPTVTFEMRPYPNRSESASVALFIDKLEEAWRQVALKRGKSV